jgi:hypothetical protein
VQADLEAAGSPPQRPGRPARLPGLNALGPGAALKAARASSGEPGRRRSATVAAEQAGTPRRQQTRGRPGTGAQLRRRRSCYCC